MEAKINSKTQKLINSCNFTEISVTIKTSGLFREKTFVYLKNESSKDIFLKKEDNFYEQIGVRDILLIRNLFNQPFHYENKIQRNKE